MGVEPVKPYRQNFSHAEILSVAHARRVWELSGSLTVAADLERTSSLERRDPLERVPVAHCSPLETVTVRLSPLTLCAMRMAQTLVHTLVQSWWDGLVHTLVG